MKVWYRSKTLWINILALIALLAGSQFGFDFSGEEQIAVLAIINLILRMITGTGLTVTKK